MALGVILNQKMDLKGWSDGTCKWVAGSWPLCTRWHCGATLHCVLPQLGHFSWVRNAAEWQTPVGKFETFCGFEHLAGNQTDSTETSRKRHRYMLATPAKLAGCKEASRF